MADTEVNTMSTTDVKVKIERQDPTSFLPDEPMSYEIKKKKKKKKKKDIEDPFKDIDDKSIQPVTIEMAPDANITTLDPEVNIKAENIEVEIDFNDFTDNAGLMLGGPHSDDSIQDEPAVKIENHNHTALLLTFENVINEKHLLTPKEEIDVNITPKLDHFCKVCHLVFQSTKTLRMHQKRKHKVFRKSFKHICDYCGMSYETKNSLVAHIKRKHGPDSTPDDNEEKTCEICALVFKGTARLRMHMRRKHGSFQDTFLHECQHCGLTYDKYRSLIVHIQRKHSNQMKPEINQWYKCMFCQKVFSKRETYARHVQRNHRIADDPIKQENVVDKSEADLGDYKNEQTGEITCKECPLVFSSVSYLKLHMRRKHNALKEDFRLKCRICNLSYNKIESLKRHVRRKHDTGSHCEVCNKQFDTREMYLNHSHTKIIKECSLCGLIFASQGGLAKHLRCTHKIDSPKTIFCSLCNEGFHDKRQLKPHLMKVHLKVSYTCVHCKKVFKAKESYRRHVLFKHPTANPVSNTQLQKCEQCTEMFKDEFELCKHINIVHRHQDEDNGNIIHIKKEDDDIKNNFQCTKCPEVYITWEQLKLHYIQCHNTTQCQICGEILPGNELQKHIKNLHKFSEMQCKYCEFKTDVKISLTQHMLRHKNAATIRCNYPGCRYKTFYEGAMEKHKKKHLDQGVKLQCTKCPFQTMNKYILKYHEEAHATGVKRYMCDQCDYATILPANLVQHKYKHSTEKRFKCDVCPFATKYNTSLRFHVRKKHCDLPTFS